MQYKELKEMKIEDWNGVPFKAYRADHVDRIFSKEGYTDLITGYVEGFWVTENHNRWNHVYPVDWNKDKIEEALKPRRMTNRQLAMWLAKGNGEFSGANYVSIHSHLSYLKEDQDKEVGKGIGVRKWGSEEWIEPTVDLLEDL